VMSDNAYTHPTDDDVVIPDGTPIIIIDLDYESEMVRIEFQLNGKVVRAWVPASHFEKMLRNRGSFTGCSEQAAPTAIHL
jgi:hypothetical protein